MTKKEAKRFLKISKSGKYTIFYPYYWSDDYSGIVLVSIEEQEGGIIAFFSLPQENNEWDDSFGDYFKLEEMSVDDFWIFKRINFSRIKHI